MTAQQEEQQKQLPTRPLGKDGPQVTAIGYGTMGLSAFYGKPKPDAERLAVLDHVYATGCRFWDSADLYGDSEELLGNWFRANPGKREHVFLATKFACAFDPATRTMTVRNDPAYIQQALDKSLARLGLPYVDLYYCHRIDPNQPIEVTVAAMQALRAAGKVRHLGLSECSADTLRRACAVAPIAAVQVEYSPFALEPEHNGLLRACRELGVALVAYSPLGRGFLAGTLRSPGDLADDDLRRLMPRYAPGNFEKNLELVDTLGRVAERKGCTVGQITLAWLAAQGDDIISIPGTTSTKNYDENMAALKVELSADEEKEIREAIAKADVAGDRSLSLDYSYVTTKPLEPGV